MCGPEGMENSIFFCVDWNESWTRAKQTEEVNSSKKRL